MPKRPSGARLTPFEIGQIKAHLHHGLSAAAIIGIVQKSDGSPISMQGMVDAIDKLQANKHWRGEREEGSGRPRVTSARLDRAIVNAVFRRRGREKVTVHWLKKRLISARRVSDSTLEARLHEAGLQWLRRRRKTLVPKKYKRSRCEYADRIKKMHRTTLERFAFTDGATWYLDKTDEAYESTQRAALGNSMWRKTDRKDALWADCVGPSSYAKAQGEPVRVWGMLSKGVLHTAVLRKGECMNRWNYATLIRRHFRKWLGGCDLLVQDHERCLHCDEPLEVLQEIGCELVDFPKCSQDLNAMENCWKLLRDRLYDTLPVARESRDDFLVRLRNAVNWLNANKTEELHLFWSNQKERAADVHVLKGGRTKW